MSRLKTLPVAHTFKLHNLSTKHVKQFEVNGLGDLNALALMDHDRQYQTLSLMDNPKISDGEIDQIISVVRRAGQLLESVRALGLNKEEHAYIGKLEKRTSLYNPKREKERRKRKKHRRRASSEQVQDEIAWDATSESHPRHRRKSSAPLNMGNRTKRYVSEQKFSAVSYRKPPPLQTAMSVGAINTHVGMQTEQTRQHATTEWGIPEETLHKHQPTVMDIGSEHCGWLLKIAGISYKKRYFQIHQGKLRYFLDDRCQKLLGQLDLSEVTKIELNRGSKKKHAFKIYTDSRSYDLAAYSLQEQVDWIKNLKQSVMMRQGKEWQGVNVTFREGFLKKQGQKRKNWKKRYFALTPGTLLYFPNEDDCQMYINMYFFAELEFEKATKKYVLGSVPTSGCQVSMVQDVDGQKYCFQLLTHDRAFYGSAETALERSLWMKAIETQSTTPSMFADKTKDMPRVDMPVQDASEEAKVEDEEDRQLSKEEKELAKDVASEIKKLGRSLGLNIKPSTSGLTVEGLRDLQRQKDTLRQDKKTRREALKEMIKMCNALHKEYDINIEDFGEEDTIVTHIFNEKIHAIGYSDDKMKEVEDYLEQLNDKSNVSQCERLYQKLGLTIDDFPDNQVAKDIFNKNVQDLSQKEVEKHLKSLKQRTRKERIKELVNECNERHIILKYTIDRYEGNDFFQAVFREDYKVIGSGKTSQKTLEAHLEKLKHRVWRLKRKNIQRQFRYQLKDVCKACNKIHEELGLTVEDYPGIDVIFYIFKERYFEIGYDENGVTSCKDHYDSIKDTTPEVRLKLMLKAINRLHKDLNISALEHEDDPIVTGIFNNTITEEKDIPAVSFHLTQLQEKHREKRLEELIKECNEAHSELGHTIDRYADDMLVKKIFDGDVQKFFPIDNTTINAVERHLDNLRKRDAKEKFKDKETERHGRAETLLRECENLHQKLGLSREDYEKDLFAQKIFDNDPSKISTTEDLEALEEHLRYLQTMLKLQNRAGYGSITTLPTEEKQSNGDADIHSDQQRNISVIFNENSNKRGQISMSKLNDVLRQVLEAQLSPEDAEKIKIPTFDENLGDIDFAQFMSILTPLLLSVQKQIDELNKSTKTTEQEAAPTTPKPLTDQHLLQKELARKAQLLQQTRSLEQVKANLSKVEEELKSREKQDDKNSVPEEAWPSIINLIDDAEESEPAMLTRWEATRLLKMVERKDKKLYLLYQSVQNIDDEEKQLKRFTKNAKRMLS